MALYPHSIVSLRQLIKDEFPLAETREYDLATLNVERIMHDWNLQLMLCEHILWMFEQVEKMEPAEKGKAGRWICWAVAYLEIMGFLTNAQTRDLIRVDVQDGNA